MTQTLQAKERNAVKDKRISEILTVYYLSACFVVTETSKITAAQGLFCNLLLTMNLNSPKLSGILSANSDQQLPAVNQMFKVVGTNFNCASVSKKSTPEVADTLQITNKLLVKQAESAAQWMVGLNPTYSLHLS